MNFYGTTWHKVIPIRSLTFSPLSSVKDVSMGNRDYRYRRVLEPIGSVVSLTKTIVT